MARRTVKRTSSARGTTDPVASSVLKQEGGADERVIELEIHDASVLEAYGIDPRLYEGAEPITLRFYPDRPRPDRPEGPTAEQVFFGIMARARDESLKPSRPRPKRSKSKKPPAQLEAWIDLEPEGHAEAC